MSGPLLDRIDMHVEAPAVAYMEFSSVKAAEPSGAIQARVVEERERQRTRGHRATLPITASGLAAAPRDTVEGI